MNLSGSDSARSYSKCAAAMSVSSSGFVYELLRAACAYLECTSKDIGRNCTNSRQTDCADSMMQWPWSQVAGRSMRRSRCRSVMMLLHKLLFQLMPMIILSFAVLDSLLCACGYVHILQVGHDDEEKSFRTQFCPFCGRRLINDLDLQRRGVKLDHFGSVLYCAFVS